MEAWVVDIKFRHPDGRVTRVRQASPIDTRRGAEQFEREVRQQLLDGTWGREIKPVPTLSEFKEDFLTYSRNNNKPSAVRSKELTLKNHLVPAFGRVCLDAIGPAEIERYKAAKLKMGLRKKGLTKKSVNNHLAILRKLLNLAVEWGRLPAAPKVKALKLPPPEFDFLGFDELTRFLAAPPEWFTFVMVPLKTGLRVGEVLALKWEDVDLKAGRLMVRRTLWEDVEGPPKGGRAREMPLGDEIAAALKRHRELHGPLKSAYVFSDAEVKRLSHSMVKDVVPSICKRAGLPKRLTSHDLRHTFASHLVMRGAPLKAVQELLGHATIDMTMRYAHLSPDVKRDAVRLLDLHSESVAEIAQNS
jgi:integrase